MFLCVLGIGARMDLGFVLFGCGGASNGGGRCEREVVSRRRFLRVVSATGMAVVMGGLSGSTTHCSAAEKQKVEKPDEEWKEELSPEAYYVLRQGGTERSFTSPLNKIYEKGTYYCVGCKAPLFASETKFDSGTGWPSFNMASNNVVKKISPMDFLMGGTEVRCASCDGHLGHVFKDGPRPTGLRYCINGCVLTFKPE